MKKYLAVPVGLLGNAIIALTIGAAGAYIVMSIVWMHAPALLVLLFACAVSIPCLLLGMLLRTAAFRLHPELKRVPLYQIDENGKMVRRRRHRNFMQF